MKLFRQTECALSIDYVKDSRAAILKASRDLADHHWGIVEECCREAIEEGGVNGIRVESTVNPSSEAIYEDSVWRGTERLYHVVTGHKGTGNGVYSQVFETTVVRTMEGEHGSN